MLHTANFLSATMEKENIADSLVLDVPVFKPPQMSPAKKPTKKSRSKSIGPGGLDAVLKPDAGNRRKSAFVPAVKSILSSKEDESKRRDARRKSLANRRVSFAPEATLHTWDVIECMAEATTSSSSSNSTRRAFGSSNAPDAISPRRANGRSPAVQSPSGLRFSPLKSPTSSRPPLIIKSKKRRSSGIPPLDFNNPEDVFSSSPASDASPDVVGPNGLYKENNPTYGDNDDDTITNVSRVHDAARSLSDGSEGSTSSSARLDEALRQASAQAGTQGIDLGDQDELTMEIAGDETTSAFKPWFNKVQETLSSPRLNMMSAAVSSPKRGSTLFADLQQEDSSDKEDELTMEMTSAVGGIKQAYTNASTEEEDATMDFTVAAGAIQSVVLPHDDRRKSLKRRRSSGIGGIANELGSPRKRITHVGDVSGRASLGEGSAEDETMELTTAIGGIKKQAKSVSEDKEDSTIDVSFGEEIMDLTTAVGGIRGQVLGEAAADASSIDQDENEELSMELTAAVGEIDNRETANIDVVTTPITGQKSTLVSKSPRETPTRRSSRMSSSPAKSNTSSPRSKLTVPQTPPKPPSNKPKATPPSAKSRRSSGAKISPQKSSQKQSPASKIAWSPIRARRFSTAPASAEKGSDAIDQQAALLVNGEADGTNGKPPNSSSNGSQKINLAESIKNLSTPRKQIHSTPMKPTPTPVKFVTPKQDSAIRTSSSAKKLLSLSARAPPRATLTPRDGRMSVGASLGKLSDGNEDAADAEDDDGEKLHLSDFLEMTSIRFMDLNTSKRRQTVATRDFAKKSEGDGAAEDENKSELEDYVVAAACTVPMLELYQHSCRELKKYIAEGKSIIRTIESATYEDNPAIFRDFVRARHDARMIMDNQFKNMKTNARLLSKAMWYDWRSNLLDDLMQGLVKIKNDFDNDHIALTRYDQSIDDKLPGLEVRYEQLRTECDHLQAHADALASNDREEIEALRGKITEREAEIDEKKRKLAELQAEAQMKEEQVDLLVERKTTFTEEIKEAQRMIEDCRGLSARELAELRARVHTLETQSGWSIATASNSVLTLTHQPDLELFLHPSSFGPNPTQFVNSPIGLTYTGNDDNSYESESLPSQDPTNATTTTTTSKRFFLQLLRAHLQCISQPSTTIRETLDLIRNTWDVAVDIADAVRKLNTSYIVTETIVGDDVLAIEVSLLLGNSLVLTKVRVRFEVRVAVRGAGSGIDGAGQQLSGGVSSRAEVVYGDKLSEKRMSEALGQMVGVDLGGAKGWYDAVRKVEGKLLARTR